MATFRSPFTRKDATRGSRPADGRLALAGLLTARSDLGALPGVISGLTVTGVASQWYYAISAGHAVTARSDADGANLPGLDGTTNTPAVSAAPGTGSRWDLIYIRQRDVDSADADSNSVIDVVQGTAGGSPTKPYASVPAGALVLAESQVSAGATGTLHANVVITQVAAKVSTRGGIVSNPTAAQIALLNAAATATNPIWIDDAGVLKRSVGAGFVPWSMAGENQPTSETTIAAPSGGETLVATTTLTAAPAGTYLALGTITAYTSTTTVAGYARFYKGAVLAQERRNDLMANAGPSQEHACLITHTGGDLTIGVVVYTLATAYSVQPKGCSVVAFRVA